MSSTFEKLQIVPAGGCSLEAHTDKQGLPCKIILYIYDNVRNKAVIMKYTLSQRYDKMPLVCKKKSIFDSSQEKKISN